LIEQIQALMGNFVVPVQMTDFTVILVIAFVFNIFFCREALLNRTFKTPQAMVARFVQTLEHRYNRAEYTPAMRRSDGVSSTIVFVVAAGTMGYGFDWAARIIPYGWIFEAMLIGTLFNMNSFLTESQVMADGLERSEEEGRATLALISGRETEYMDGSNVARVMVETTARKASAGVVSPALYFWAFGGIGLFIFKIVNIATDMIDERSPTEFEYGWAVARFNEFLIWPGALVTAMYIWFAAIFVKGASLSKSIVHTFRSGGYYQRCTRWPVAAIAGALKLRLGGPMIIEGSRIEAHWVGDGADLADSKHIRDARKIFSLCAAFALADMGVWLWFGLAAPANYIPFIDFDIMAFFAEIIAS
jgi:adenosylcobinamide-phosphate synthase